MQSVLRTTRWLVVAAFVPLAVGLGLQAPHFASRLYPRTVHALQSAAIPSGDLPKDSRVFDVEWSHPSGPDLVVERTATHGTRIARTDCGEAREAGDQPIRCGSVTVNRPPEQIGLLRIAEGRLVVVQRLTWAVPAGQYHQLPRLAAFDLVDRDDRFLAPRRLLSSTVLPHLVLLLAAIALGVAAVGTRRAHAYVTRLSGWREGTLDREGLVRVGHDILRFASRFGGLTAGPILVDPDALPSGAYRDALRIEGSAVVTGSHEAWKRGTARRLRDARALSVVATVCTLLAVASRLVGD